MDTTSCVSYVNTRTSCFIWKIKQYETLLLYRSETPFKSGYFNIKGIRSKFYLTVSPDSHSVHLNSTESVKEFRIFCQLFLINASGEKTLLVITSLYPGDKINEEMKMYSFKELKENKLLPEGTLTLCLVIGRQENVMSTGIDANSNIQVRLRECKTNGALHTAFTKLFNDKKETDIVLRVGEDEIKAHKLVLVCRSTVFAAMMDHDMHEKKTNEVNIEDVEFDVMCALVRFLYSDEVDCRDVNFSLKLLAAADKYDIALLKAQCAFHIYQNISEKDVFLVLKVATTLNESELVTCCKDFIGRMSPTSCLVEFHSQKELCPEIADVLDLLKSDK